MNISGRTKLFGLVGDPVDHSLSPAIQNLLMARCGVDGAYLAFRVPSGGAGAFVQAARTLGMGGFNVTMPLKGEIMRHLDEVTDRARTFGAVNTVLLRDGRLLGDNTDGPGFLAALEHRSFDTAGPDRHALVLGSGGAARTVALSLHEKGFRVAMVSRGKAGHLEGHPDIAICSWADLPARAASCALLVNCTPLGMEGKEPFADLRFLESLPRGAWVADLVYAPRRTALLERSAALGYATMGGFEHLVFQGVLAFTLFTGQKPPDGAIEELLKL